MRADPPSLLRVASLLLAPLAWPQLADAKGCLEAGQGAMGAPPETAVIAHVTTQGAIVTREGVHVRLAGLAPVTPASGPGMERFRASWTGATVTLRRLAASPDRWGRVAALVASPSALPGMAPLLLNAVAVGEGLALSDPADAPLPCRAELTRAEADARNRKLGVWSDLSGVLVSGEQSRDLAEAHAGRFRMVEGRVRRVSESRGQVYVDLGPFGSLSPSLRMQRRNVAHILPSGMDAAALRGRSLRTRGVIETSGDRIWMVLDRASRIEVLD
jgi:hypothetical protein